MKTAVLVWLLGIALLALGAILLVGLDTAHYVITDL